MANQKRREYTHSPWSGKGYEKPPTVEELTRESRDVLKRNPVISKAMGLDAMGRFIAAHKAGRDRLLGNERGSVNGRNE